MKSTNKFLFIVFFLLTSPLCAQIVVTDIPAISTEHFGLFDNTSEFSMGDDLWGNSKLDKNTFATDPGRYFLTAKSYDLIRRVLLTSAPAPYAFENDVAFARNKMNMLYSFGMHNELAEIMAKYSAKHKLPAEYRKMRIDSSLLSLYYKRACALSDSEDANEIYFDHLRVFCQIYRKQTSAAALSIQIMREQNIKGEFFYELADAIIENESPIDAEKSTYIEPVYFGLYYLNSHPFNPPVAKNDKIWRLKAIFGHKNASLKSRIEAGEILLQRGIITPDDFKKVIVLASAKTKENIQQAVDYRRVISSSKPAQKAEIIGKILSNARKNKLFIAYSMLYAPLIKDIVPEAAVIANANEIIPALLYAGFYDTASEWEKIAERESEVNPVAKKAAHIYAPLIKILTGKSHYGSSSKALERFYEQKKNTAGEEAAKKSLRLLLDIYDAYGIDYDSKLYLTNNHLLTVSDTEHSSMAKLTEEAVDAGRTGDVIIFGLQALSRGNEVVTPFLKYLRNNSMKTELDDIATAVMLTNI